MKLFDNIKDGLKRVVSFSDEEDYDDDENYGDDDFDDDDDDDEESAVEAKKNESEKTHYDVSSSGYNPPEYGKKSSFSPSASYGGGFKQTQKNNSNLYKIDSKPQPKKLKVTLFVLEDMDDARNVADCMIERGVVTLADMTKLPTESVRRVLDFLDGVKYVCKSKIEVIAEKIYLIVPEAAELSGDFFSQTDRPSFL